MDPAHLSFVQDQGFQPDYTATIARALGSFIQSNSATFACGGSIPTAQTSTTPVTLRWDSSHSLNANARLRFPVDPADEPSIATLTDLAATCQPASFGHHGENVLDETYRRATKMDRSAFSVDFCPYEVGVIDTVAQMLLPNSRGYVGTSGIRAELYKLNIYAAPSGFFKTHVDTPRSPRQFGSLVVALPCYHKGGQLVVRHAQNAHTFDWGVGVGGTVPSAVQWAAFYSDCEHEVLEVTEGYRITLTYNLYHAPGVGDLAGNSPALDTTSLPLFHYVQQTLKRDDFLHGGGILGVYCQHAYAHAHEDRARALPAILKGTDMAVYTVFKTLGLEIEVRAILDTDIPEFEDYYEEQQEDSLYCSEEYQGQPYTPPIFQSHAVVAALGGHGIADIGYGGEGLDEIVHAWSDDFREVQWVNKPRQSELDMIHLTYGNEAGIGTLYSHAALLIRIPAALLRNAYRTEKG